MIEIEQHNRSLQKAKDKNLEQKNKIHRYTEGCSQQSEEKVSQDSQVEYNRSIVSETQENKVYRVSQAKTVFNSDSISSAFNQQKILFHDIQDSNKQIKFQNIKDIQLRQQKQVEQFDIQNNDSSKQEKSPDSRQKSQRSIRFNNGTEQIQNENQKYMNSQRVKKQVNWQMHDEELEPQSQAPQMISQTDKIINQQSVYTLMGKQNDTYNPMGDSFSNEVRKSSQDKLTIMKAQIVQALQKNAELLFLPSEKVIPSISRVQSQNVIKNEPQQQNMEEKDDKYEKRIVAIKNQQTTKVQADSQSSVQSKNSILNYKSTKTSHSNSARKKKQAQVEHHYLTFKKL